MTRRASAKPAPAAKVSERPDRVSAQLTARLQRQRVEVAGERTESTTLWANPDGTFTTEGYAGPVRVREGGQWKPLDTTLIAADGVVRSRTAAAPVQLSAGGSGRPFASLDRGKRSLGMSWPGVLPAPQLSKDTATYKDVVADGDGDLVVTAMPRGFSHSVVLYKAPTRQVDIRLPVALKGMKLKELPKGQLELTDAKGTAVAGAPAPRMWDATKNPLSGDSDHQAQVPATVEQTPGGAVLVLKPDPEYFQNPDLKYPVTIDPTQSLVVSADTYVASTETGSQYNSADLKVGTWNSGSTLARSYVQFNTSKLAGKHILSADFRAWAWWSSQCTAAQSGTQVRRVASSFNIETIDFMAEPASSTTGAAVSTASPGGSCPEDWMHWNTTSIVQAWANGTANYGFQLRAVNAADSTSWRRFRSSNYVLGGVGPLEPRLDVTWNSYPDAASKLSSSTVIGADGNRYAATATPTLSGAAADADGGAMRMDFEVANTSGTTVWSGSANTTAGTPASVTVPAGTLTNGTAYQWRARGYDGSDYAKTWSAYQGFTVDTSLPAAPTVSCAAYPQDVWSDKSATAVTCTLDSDSGDGAGYLWSIDDPEPKTLAADPNGTGGDPLSISVNPSDGWHTLYAKTRDSALNTSTVTAYAFGVGVGSITSLGEDDRTQEAVSLTSTAPTSKVGVTYKYRAGTDNSLPWTTVPAGDVTPPGSSTPLSGWPLTRADTSQGFAAEVWDMAKSLQAAGKGDGPVQIKACFTETGGTGEECSAPVTVTLERTAFGSSYATQDLGPGQLAALTGDYSLDTADVTVAGLSVSRTHTTLVPASHSDATSVFGPGWTASFPAEESSDSEYRFEDHSVDGYVLLLGSDGETLTYNKDSSGKFTGSGAADDGSSITQDSTTQFTLHDSDGTETVYTKVNGLWAPDSTDPPGNNNSTTFLRDTQGRVSRILAAAPAGVTCTASSLESGCKALDITYATTTTATAIGSGWGDYAGNVSKIDYTAYDPATANMKTTTVASYLYDSTGHLRQAWDARITPALKTTYYYNTNGRISQITPPGQAPWTLSYDTGGRLADVTRDDGQGNSRTQAVAYRIPITGTGAPIDLSSAQTNTWGQSIDLPRIGTAAFPASHVPSKDSSGTYTPDTGDWKYAQLTYMDVNGRAVNNATFGAGAWQFDATRYDSSGQAVWTLTADNRAQAVTPTSSTDPYVAGRSSSVDRAGLLAAVSTYDTDGNLLTQTDPTHQVQLKSGATVSARKLTTNTYDEGKPDSTTYNLVTTTKVEPMPVDDTAAPTAADAITTTTGYDPIVAGDTSGWTLRNPTTQTVVMDGSANLTRRTRYDGTGSVIETRQPSSDGNDAGTNAVTYYTVGTNSVASCGNKPQWAGQVCQSGPKAQPSGPSIPTKTFTYTYDGQPAQTTETSGSTTRTQSLTYDAASRITGSALIVSPASAGGTAVPDATYQYNSDTGVLTSISASGSSISIEHDALGSVTSYTDATGAISTYTYNADGQIATANDGKGTYTYTYDGTDAAGREEHRGLPIRIDSGTGSVFTGAYSPGGQLILQNNPNGLVATRTYDNAEQFNGLSYTKSGSTWLAFASGSDTYDRKVWQTGPNGNQEYTYDKADRLTKTVDAYAASCNTRVYTFNANSDRTSLTTYPGAADQTCSTSTTPTVANSGYDTADRKTDSGYTYDTLGRATALPAADVTGGADVQIGYYVNDKPASFTQAGQTQTVALDPGWRISTLTSSQGTTTNHYANSGDNPAWISEPAGTWTRNVTAFDGLAVIENSSGAAKVQITNLHGDVVATVDNSTTATGIDAYFEQEEYGRPRAENPTNPTRYGWLGKAQRSGEILGGLVLMGARVYNPTTGVFLSVDPVEGGGANSYSYPTDPVNKADIDGRRWGRWHLVHRSSYRYQGWHTYRVRHYREQDVINLVGLLTIVGWLCDSYRIRIDKWTYFTVWRQKAMQNGKVTGRRWLINYYEVRQPCLQCRLRLTPWWITLAYGVWRTKRTFIRFYYYNPYGG